MAESGRTRIYTRRQQRRILLAGTIALIGTALAAGVGTAVASALAGQGWQAPSVHLRPIFAGGILDSATDSGADVSGGRMEAALGGTSFPLAVSWPEVPLMPAIVVSAPIWVLWLVVLVRPMLRRLHHQTRWRGLASLAEIRRVLGARVVRRAGIYTLPGTTRLQRFLLPTKAFGYRLLTPAQPKGRSPAWADWEQRIRLIARTGWGKAARLLVPIIRDLPGPALVSSTEPAIFEQTVLARATRADPIRWRWQRRLQRNQLRNYPVAVADFSDPLQRWTTGWPVVRWDPIPACADHSVAYRRAEALVAGADNGSDRGSDNDRFFRDSATEVLAAWMHAAALGRKSTPDLLKWLRKPDDPTPKRILDDDRRADPSAALNLDTHLDHRAERTTSGVLRYLALALNSVATADGQAMCAPERPGSRADVFDMEMFIRDGGTVYLLADASRIDRARPLLSLFATEMFLAAERVALTHPGKRLPRPFVGVLDELRYGVTVSNLPYVASAQRKYGIGLIWAVQSSSQENAVYGDDAPALRDAAGVTIVGGIDIELADELADRAGTTTVVTASRGPGHRSEHTEQQQSLTIADQQALVDGEAVVYARGLTPFIARAASIYEQRRLMRCIGSEAEQIAAGVAAANSARSAVNELSDDAEGTGFDLNTHGWTSTWR